VVVKEKLSKDKTRNAPSICRNNLNRVKLNKESLDNKWKKQLVTWIKEESI
jgi:hypothetical protein